MGDDKEVGLLVSASERQWRGQVRAQVYDWTQIAERVLHYYAQRRSFAARRVDRWEVEHAHG